LKVNDPGKVGLEREIVKEYLPGFALCWGRLPATPGGIEKCFLLGHRSGTITLEKKRLELSWQKSFQGGEPTTLGKTIEENTNQKRTKNPSPGDQYTVPSNHVG